MIAMIKEALLKLLQNPSVINRGDGYEVKGVYDDTRVSVLVDEEDRVISIWVQMRCRPTSEIAREILAKLQKEVSIEYCYKKTPTMTAHGVWHVFYYKEASHD